MELQQFRYFLEAAKHENFTKAADELHIAQPALSQSIRRLETELGVSLFHRMQHRIALNDQGKLLEKRIAPILESIDNLKDELWESVYTSEQTVRLNFVAASPLITKCIISYREKNGRVKFQVSQLELGDGCDINIDSQPSLEEAELALRRQELPAGIVRREFLSEDIFLAVPSRSPLASRKSVDLRELQGEGYIRLGHSWQLRGICDDFFRWAGIRPQVIFESNSPESVRNLIAAGLGIGFWPERSWGGPPGRQVTLVPIEYPKCRRTLQVALSEQGAKKQSAREFYEYLCECFRNESVWGMIREKKDN